MWNVTYYEPAGHFKEASSSRMQAEASEGGCEEDPCPTERGDRVATDCRRAWPIASDCLQDYEEVFDLCEGDVVPEPDYQAAIAKVCDDLKDFLLQKNASYGNSALEPNNTFSQLDAKQGIFVRIDDKLKRIRNARGYPGDNDVKDLTGYLILLMVLEEVGQ